MKNLHNMIIILIKDIRNAAAKNDKGKRKNKNDMGDAGISKESRASFLFSEGDGAAWFWMKRELDKARII